MEIKNNQYDNNGSFEAFEDGVEAGVMTYVLGEGTLTIDHTEVGEEFSGKGVGSELVDAAVEFARKEDRKIIPVCSFAKKVLTESDEYKDVL